MVNPPSQRSRSACQRRSSLPDITRLNTGWFHALRNPRGHHGRTITAEIHQQCNPRRAQTSHDNHRPLLTPSNETNRRVPKFLARAIAHQQNKSVTELRTELRQLCTSRRVRGHKDFESINKSEMLNPEQRNLYKALAAAKKRDRAERVQQQALLRNTAAEGALRNNIRNREERRALVERSKMQRCWLEQTEMASRVSMMAAAMQEARERAKLTIRQATSVLCMQRQWRLFAFRRAVARRIGARKLLVRVITQWVRRHILPWRRKHAAVITGFMSVARSVQGCLKHAMMRYRWAVVFVQRRWRAYKTMWREREAIARVQFDQVSQVMVQKNERKVLKQNRTLRKQARHINNILVEAAVRSIPRQPSASEKDRTLSRSCKNRKKAYLTALYEWFVARNGAVAKARATAAVEWAR